MGKIFVTSDIWFNRPGGKMTETYTWEYNDNIIANWNKTVGKNDDVYILGGIGISDMYQLLIKLNGKIHILNNYFTEDENFFINTLQKSVNLSADKNIKNKIIFEASQIISLPDEDAILSYYPLDEWGGVGTGTFNFHGFTSGSDLERCRISCKMDDWDYKPVNIKDVKNNLNKFKEKVYF